MDFVNEDYSGFENPFLEPTDFEMKDSSHRVDASGFSDSLNLSKHRS